MEADHDVDRLLERYLHLLNEYTSLRAGLTNLQTDMHQNIARANYSADRGMRIGQDFYDDRMQASRKIAITSDSKGLPVFNMFDEGAQVKMLDSDVNVAESEQCGDADTLDDDAKKKGKQQQPQAKIEAELDAKSAKKTKSKDPLKWYGMFTPTQLRQAQNQSIQAVEDIVPKLVSINAEMAQVEIEVRRARKKRAKAEAVAKKQEEEETAGNMKDIAT